MTIARNMLLAWHGADGKTIVRVERILVVAPDQTTAVTIGVQHLNAGGTGLVEDTIALPVRRPIGELEGAPGRPGPTVLTRDPYADLLMSEEDAARRWGAGYAARKNSRDQAWQKLDALLTRAEEGGLDLFVAADRGALIRELSGRGAVSPTTLLGWLRRWWQRGMIPNALFPNFDARGGPGKPRKPGERKRGAPHKSLRNTPVRRGVNLTADMWAKCREVLDSFYLNTNRRSLEDTYQELLKRHYKVGEEADEQGEARAIFAHERPSPDQFNVVWKKLRKELGPEEVIKRREGPHKWNTSRRPSTKDTMRAATGPLAIVQGDAYRGDVELVSLLNRFWRIGVPIIYILRDVFSLMVVGLYIGLDGPNWAGMSMAFLNILEDKVEYGRAHGVDIKPGVWSVQDHCPETIIFDRGLENLGLGSDQLVTLDVEVKNLPPLRPDYKPFVEQYFKLIKDTMLIALPGAFTKREYGDPDLKQKAQLTIDEIRTLLIGAIAKYNHTYTVKHHPLMARMIADGVVPTPANIYKWGLVHCSGSLRRLNLDTAYRVILPRGKATVDGEAIHFKGLRFECDRAWKEGWFVDKKRPSYWDGTVSYDDRLTDRIYLMLGPQEFEVATLMEKSLAFKGLYWQEATMVATEQDEVIAQTKDQERAYLATIDETNEAILRTAAAETKAALADMRPRDRTVDKAAHRADDAETVRRADAARVAGAVPAPKGAVVTPIRARAAAAAPPPATAPPAPSTATPPVAPAPISPFRRRLDQHRAKETGHDD